jgi:hypothetical protein
MTLNGFLTVFSLALSIGGLVRILLNRDRAREILIAVIVAAVAILSAVMLFNHYRHQKQVKDLSVKITEALRTETRTFDDLYGKLYYVEFPMLNESLAQLVDRDIVGHKMLALTDHTGRGFNVRGYYAK